MKPNTDDSYKQDPDTVDKVNRLLDGMPNESDSAPVQDNTSKEDERMETERNTTYDKDKVTQDKVFSWAMRTPEDVEVEVTDMDKAKYIKAILHDKPVILSIDLSIRDSSDINVSVDIRTLNNYEKDVVYVALDKDREEGLITGYQQLSTRMQYYAGALQVVNFCGNTAAHISFPEPGNTKVDAETLRTVTKEYVGKLHWPKWQAMVAALRVFEAKMKICNDAALNGNFWMPPGADS
jgi:hypothetical protein